MRLLSPNALWFLTLIPIFILMYILKQKFEEKEIGSLFLWQQVLQDTEAASPFQRLRKNILFFLQFLILLLIIFSLTDPFLLWKNKNYENVIMVIDTSGSMSAKADKNTRLEEAKKKATEGVRALASSSKITLITCGENSRVEISGSTDKKQVINKINEVKEMNSAGDINDCYSLVKAISNQYKSYKIIYFSDRTVDMKELNGEVVNVATEESNVSIDYISHSVTDKGMKVMMRVTNHGKEKGNIELCLYGESKLISLKNINIKSGETQTVYFDNVPQNNKYIYGEISQKDALEEDNTIYSIIKQKDARKILLVAEQNVFLEKAIAALKDVELYKTVPGEKITEDFDLYIYDGKIPKELPQKGNIMIINPSDNNALFTVGQEVEGGNAKINSHAITKYMGNSDFIISKFREIKTPYWGNTLFKIGDKEVSFVGEQKGQRIGVLGFDLHNTDLPLTSEFPIFINNLISYLIDRDTLSSNSYNCGESITIDPLPEAEKINVLNPDKVNEEISSKYPVKPYENTVKPGIYEIRQKIGNNEDSKLIAVNFPTTESDISVQKSTSNSVKNSSINIGGISLNFYLLLLALIVIIIEWIFYIRSY